MTDDLRMTMEVNLDLIVAINRSASDDEAIARHRPEPFRFRAGGHVPALVNAFQDSGRAGAWRNM